MHTKVEDDLCKKVNRQNLYFTTRALLIQNKHYVSWYPARAFFKFQFKNKNMFFRLQVKVFRFGKRMSSYFVFYN